MSGRIHLFLMPEQESKLHKLLELGGHCTEDSHPLALSHVAQCALEHLLHAEKFNLLTPEQVEKIKQVQDPPNNAHTTVFLKQVNIKQAFDMLEKYDINHHDYSLCWLHICGIEMMYDDLWHKLQESNVPEQKQRYDAIVTKLSNVTEPKTVYHR